MHKIPQKKHHCYYECILYALTKKKRQNFTDNILSLRCAETRKSPSEIRNFFTTRRQIEFMGIKEIGSQNLQSASVTPSNSLIQNFKIQYQGDFFFFEGGINLLVFKRSKIIGIFLVHSQRGAALLSELARYNRSRRCVITG